MDKRLKYLFIFTLIFLTLFLRFLWLDHAILEGDMFRDLTIATNITEGHLRLAGITAGTSEFSNQQSFGPIMYYIIAVLILISKNPLFVVGFIALINSIAVLLTYLFCKKYFSEKIALFASILYAVNPWAVYMSDIFWNPNFLPIFSILLFYSIFKFIIEKKDWALIILTFIIAIMLHFHLTPLFYLIILGLSMLLFRRDVKNKYYFYSLISFIIPFIPFIYFNLKHGYSLLGPILYGTTRESNSFFTSLIESIGIPVMLGTNYLGKYVYGNSFIFYNKIFYYYLFLITILLVFLFILGLFYLLILMKKNTKFNNQNKQTKYYLIFFIFVIPIMLHFLRFSNISPHYYFMIYPIQFIIYGFIFEKLFNKFKILSIIIILIIVFSNILSIYALHNYIEKNGSTKGGEFSISYKNKIEVMDFIENNSDNNYKIVYYGRSYKSFNYLFNLRKNNYEYVALNSTEQIAKFKGYYLILDRISYHRTILNDNETNYFNNLKEHYKIGSVDVYKIK